MQKTFILLLTITFGIVNQLIAQSPLVDKKGTASFFSEAPLENIEAVNKKAFGAIDLQKGTLAVSIKIKDFQFEQSLMQEHFNENYLESDKYPVATFMGKIMDFSNLDFSKKGVIEVMVEGEMEIHGVKKPLTTPVQFDISNNNLKASTAFQVAVNDFDIEIPKLLFQNIAEVVEVKALFNFLNQ